MPRKHRKRIPPPDQDLLTWVRFLGYSVLWDLDPGFNLHHPDQPGFRAFPYFGA